MKKISYFLAISLLAFLFFFAAKSKVSLAISPTLPACTTHAYVSGSIAAGANNSTTVSCNYGLANLDCVSTVVKVGTTPSNCTFTGWNGKDALFNCAVPISTVSSVVCTTFSGSAANCCPTTSSPLSLEIPGDTNGDRVVSFLDYFYYVTAKNGGTIPTNVIADLNKDGKVDDKDLAYMLKPLLLILNQ